MKKSILLLAVCAIALAGCKKEKDEGVAIQISTQINSSTKAAVIGTSFPNDAKSVFAVSASTVKGDLSTPHFSSANVDMVGSTPTFSPAQFYPSSGSLYFYAYAPSTGIYNGGSAQPTVAYNLSTSNEQDIMWAKDDIGHSKSGNTSPAFAFVHKLMMFKFKVKCDSGSPINGLYVKQVDLIDQPVECTLNLVDGTLNFGTKTGTVNAYSASGGNGIQISETLSNTEFGCAMIAPSTSSFKVKVTFGSNEVGALNSSIEATGNLTTTSEGVAGKSHIIAMTMSPKDIKMTSTITDWVPGAGGTVDFQ